jgi:hypothetical protein
MSAEFTHFSEASRLYAQNLEVVRKMEELFLNDVSLFLGAVHERMQAKLETGRIGEDEFKEYRCWWIKDEDTNADDYVPYLWIERRNNKIIVPGILTVVADFDEASGAEKGQLAAIKSSLNLPPHCKLVDKRLFGVTITLGDQDPVEAASEPILSILIALHEVEKGIMLARAKDGPIKKNAVDG